MDMDLILETFATLALLCYYIIEGVIKAILPIKYLPKKDISNDIVLVTGAGSGIGRLMSIQFAKLGSTLVLWDINETGNLETAEMIKRDGGNAACFTVDCSKREAIYAAADKVRAEVGDVTILVNNAGIVTGKKFLQSPDSLIEKTMEVNTMAHFWTVKAFLPAMMEMDRGHIVSIASSAGLVGVSGLADYCASKFGAVGFMESLLVELFAEGRKNIHGTTVCPFTINTGMFDGFSSRFPSVLPILEPSYVVNQIVEAVLTNQSVLCTPRIVYPLLALKS